MSKPQTQPHSRLLDLGQCCGIHWGKGSHSLVRARAGTWATLPGLKKWTKLDLVRKWDSTPATHTKPLHVLIIIGKNWIF